MPRFLASRLRAALFAALVVAAFPATTSAGSSGATGKGPSEPPSGIADTATPGSPDAAPAEFYVRAGFVLDGSKRTRFKDAGDCSSTSPAALYGCGDGVDGAPLGSAGDFGTMAGFEVGLGYAASSALRLEALLQYRPRFSFRGRANFLRTPGRQAVSAKLSSLTGMLTAYLDLPALGGPGMKPVTPFIGSGAGLSIIRIGDTRMEFPGLKQTTVVPGGRRTSLAWMVTAGLALSWWDEVTLDLAWRYTDHGAVRTDRGDGTVDRDGWEQPLVLDLAPTRASLRGHGFMVSLRYGF